MSQQPQYDEDDLEFATGDLSQSESDTAPERNLDPSQDVTNSGGVESGPTTSDSPHRIDVGEPLVGQRVVVSDNIIMSASFIAQEGMAVIAVAGTVDSNLGFQLGRDDDDIDDAQAARWRRAILGLSENLKRASDERPELSGVLMEAMHHALEQLLVFGDENELFLLEEWLDLETAEFMAGKESRSAASSVAAKNSQPSPIERRRNSDRRHGPDRRAIDRRAGIDRRDIDGHPQARHVRVWTRRDPAGFWIAEAPSYPGCACVAATHDEALQALRERLRTHVHIVGPSPEPESDEHVVAVEPPTP